MNEKGKEQLTIIPLDGVVLYPGRTLKLKVKSKMMDRIKDQIEKNQNQAIALTAKPHEEEQAPKHKAFYRYGNLVQVKTIEQKSDGYQVEILVVERVEVTNWWKDDSGFAAEFERRPDLTDMVEKNKKEMLAYVKKMVADFGEKLKGSASFVSYIQELETMEELMAVLVPYMDLTISQQQALLEMRSQRKRSLRFLDLIMEHQQAVEFKMEMDSKFSDEMTKAYRERMLRERLRSIQAELGELDGNVEAEDSDFKAQIDQAEMPEEAEKVAKEEAKKLARMNEQSAEYNVVRNYLDLLTALPWKKKKPAVIELDAARAKLNERHYGLDDVKERIIQHLTVMKLKKDKQGSIILLVGPPGTGKTSLGKSVAEALDRKYVRVSLGGVRDEAEIRGHRRTYIGAMPGRIVQGMKRAGTNNPVFILDEVDKMMASNNGDPISALLEVLDPEQNNTFHDHYLDVSYDLSDVFFIATANSLQNIPGPLRDRMEIIQVGSYTSREKFHIAKDHLLPEVLEEHGLNESQLTIDDEAVRTIIDKYTREAGVRSLKRQLTKMVRSSAERILLKEELPIHIQVNQLFDLLGHEIARYDKVGEVNPPGVVTGLAWTPVGGDILFIEAAAMPGKGNLLLTGQLGDVMKESARISLSLIRSRLGDQASRIDLTKNDLHIHVPAGATPKDGPSAGVTLFATIASLVTGRPVDSKLAMTGEVSLSGRVLPVGGIKEKVIAAHRSGIRRILLPVDNKIDLDDVPDEVKRDLDFIFLERVEDVLREALEINLEGMPTMSLKNLSVAHGAQLLWKYPVE
jgi:ATP-dependent Lon protease